MDQQRSLVQVFDQACKRFADNPAYTALGHTLTFGELHQLSHTFAAWLQHETQLEPGDRIAIQLPNLLQYPVVAFGALQAGLVVVNTNPLYTERELSHQLRDSGARALVVLENFAARAAAVVGQTQVEQVVTTQVADLHPMPRRLVINSAVKYFKKQVPPFAFKQSISLLDALQLGQNRPFIKQCSAPENLAILQYTGGTTGVAKGAMLTHANLVANMQQVKNHIPVVFEEGIQTYCAPLPLYHIYAFNMHLLCAMSSGNHSVLVPNPRDLNSLIKVFKNYPITGFMSLNTLYNALLNHKAFLSMKLPHLRYCSAGGMAMMTDTSRHWFELTGCEIMEGYGLTETSPVVTINPVGAVRRGTIGTALLDTELKVVDEQGRELATGERGELCVRGPQVMKGYWHNPEETAAVLSDDGWLATGDVATIDKDGYVRIVDRIKDMIDVSGFKVYPHEVEDVVSEHPDIIECAVVGVPSDETGEAVKLVVVPRDKHLQAETVRAYCQERLTAYKVPREIEFVDELPKTNVGKVLRRKLRPDP